MEKRASYHIFYYAFLWYDYEVGTIPMKNKEKKKQCVWQDLKGFTSNTKWKRVRKELSLYINKKFDLSEKSPF